MPTLDGKTYEMQYLTDEETAVINAMRMGGDVDIIFYESSKEAYEAHRETLKNVLKFERITDCSDAEKNPFIAYEMRNADYGSTVNISHNHHFVDE